MEHSDPYSMRLNAKPVMNPELYNIMLETKVARELNKLHKSPFLALLTDPKTLFILAVLLIILVYVARGG